MAPPSPDPHQKEGKGQWGLQGPWLPGGGQAGSEGVGMGTPQGAGVTPVALSNLSSVCLGARVPGWSPEAALPLHAWGEQQESESPAGTGGRLGGQRDPGLSRCPGSSLDSSESLGVCGSLRTGLVEPLRRRKWTLGGALTSRDSSPETLHQEQSPGWGCCFTGGPHPCPSDPPGSCFGVLKEALGFLERKYL